MRPRLTIAAAAALGLAFLFLAARLFGIQFAAGSVYPEYSSLRSDPMGSRLLFDALAATSGIRVERNFLPNEYLPHQGTTILFLAVPPDRAAEDRQVFEKAATGGNRVVVALDLTEGPKTLENDKDGWRLKIETDSGKGRAHRYYFGECPGWRVLDRAGPKALAIERDFGKGSVALFAGNSDFNNQSTLACDRLRQVTAALGPNSHIVFDEQHLGIAEGGSIMQMARRFRLGGLVLGLLLVAALFLWRDATGFPPTVAASGSGGRMAGRTSQAGLLTLLRRHVAPRDLAAACWQEWLNGNRGQVSAERAQRCAEIAARTEDRPLDAVREIAAALHAKGEF
jgi:hypothetical protein